MDFGEVLTKAWKIIWKYKVLWVFGILSSCGQGTGGGGGGGGGNTGIQYSGGDGNQLPPGMREFFYNIEHFFNKVQGWEIALVVVGLLVFFLLLGLIFAALSTVGKIGLIQGTVKAEDDVESMSFMELFESGKPFFWRVFLFNFLVGVAIFVLILILMIPFIGIAVMTMGIGMFCLLPLICILVPLSWLFSVLLQQITIAIVVEDLSIQDAIRRGWDIFRENIGNMIVMGLILGIGGAVISVVMSLPMIFVMFPIVIGIIGGTAASSEALFGGGFAVAALCCISYLPVLIVLGGILQSYIHTAWTLTYLRLTKGSPAPKEEDLLLEPVEEPNPEEDQ